MDVVWFRLVFLFILGLGLEDGHVPTFWLLLNSTVLLVPTSGFRQIPSTHAKHAAGTKPMHHSPGDDAQSSHGKAGGTSDPGSAVLLLGS